MEPKPFDAFAAALADRYVIERELGRGGMSIVYLARDLKVERRVAVKVLRPELAAAVGSQRFAQEIQVVATLQHPNILPLYDSGVAAGQLYYVMPLVEGPSLRERLTRERQIPVDDALQIARDVGDGLSYAHGHGVVHRDIKPENILLAGGRAIIADFGVARVVAAADQEQLSTSGIAVGTPLYMSPEQASGDAGIDARSDIYALGCVLYEMLSGEPPFTGTNTRAILARKLEEPPRSLRVVRPVVSPHLEGTITRALAPVAADRFGDVGEFTKALALTGERRRPRPWKLRAAWYSGAGLIAALALWLAIRPRPVPDRSPPDPNRIAVLYFDDRSADGSLRHVATGLTEDLIDGLSHVGALHVVPPSGVRPYREHLVPLDSLVRALSVGTLVEGSVARPGNTLRISVRLVDPVGGKELDERTLERPWGDLFALEKDIADEVARFLRQRLGREVLLRERRAGTRSVAAWELMRRVDDMREEAAALSRMGDGAGAERVTERADTLLDQAASLDREWAEPLVQRGWLSVNRADLPTVTEPTQIEQLLVKAQGFAQRALRVTPNDAAALELRGYVRFRQWLARGSDTAAASSEAAERDLRQAVTLNPGLARGWNTLSLMYSLRGEFTEAAVTLNRALEADAYLQDAARSTENLFFASLERGDFTAARRWCDIGRTRFPEHAGLRQCGLLLLGWTGHTAADAQAAWRMLRDIESRDTTNQLAVAWAVRRWMVAAVLARAGLGDSATAVLQRTRATASDSVMLREGELYEAYVYTLLNERDQALAALEALIRADPSVRSYVAGTRWFLSLHDDPRFTALVGQAP